jgi:protoporphyrinogen oxidase
MRRSSGGGEADPGGKSDMKIAILGGGLAGISLAYFLQNDPRIESIDLLEKENKPGGLCRSFKHDGMDIDIGPHIFFSKDKETLGFMLDLLGDNQRELRRSNRIIHEGRLVQYPFENDLSKLPIEDCKRCVDTFLNNPYRDYPAGNMLQFFLKTFGEGITDLYLRPYNEKIWKFDPAFMDTQMVERIPRPPNEDILRSAAGETVDGYTHQLHFSYPKRGGTAAFIEAFAQRLNGKVQIHTDCEVLALRGDTVETSKGAFRADGIASCLPPQAIADEEIKPVVAALKYNNIMLAVATVDVDRAGDNFAFMIADRKVLFHRLSKVDFLGGGCHIPNTATYLMEYTYRSGDLVAALPNERLRSMFIDGLREIRFIENDGEVRSFTLKRFPYAYVIYDLEHKRNMSAVREHFARRGVRLNGRFGNFEYWNMDRVIAESRKTAERMM